MISHFYSYAIIYAPRIYPTQNYCICVSFFADDISKWYGYFYLVHFDKTFEQMILMLIGCILNDNEIRFFFYQFITINAKFNSVLLLIFFISPSKKQILRHYLPWSGLDDRFTSTSSQVKLCRLVFLFNVDQLEWIVCMLAHSKK